ncbi:MAG: sulfite exporter TauE/SafE family protein, partial [Gammaproteobacteria bacterium]
GGRLATYLVLGAAFGAAGAVAGDALAAWRGWVWLRLLAAAVMLSLGLYLGGWWSGGNRVLEQAGLVLWRRLSPLTRALLPVDTPVKAIASGMVWGLLPCGLIYYSLLWALASGGALEGAGFMLAFGLGTLPTLLTIGLSAQAFARSLQRRGVRRAGGLLLITLALWTAAATLLHQPSVGLGCISRAG